MADDVPRPWGVKCPEPGEIVVQVYSPGRQVAQTLAVLGGEAGLLDLVRGADRVLQLAGRRAVAGLVQSAEAELGIALPEDGTTRRQAPVS